MVNAVKPVSPPRRYLVSGVASDAHTWNLVFLQLLIEEYGHEVVNLGACVPVDLLVSACLRYRPHTVVLSTVNGHGYMDGLRAITSLRRHRELDDCVVVIGGKLGTRGADDAALVQPLLDGGFDAVFTDTGLGPFTELLMDTGAAAAPSPRTLAG